MADLIPLAGERQHGETRKAMLACNDYLRMGPGRSLQKLCDRYHIATEAPPTKRLMTLKNWSRRYNWQNRAAAYDAKIEEQKNEERRRILRTGLAQDFRRVSELKRLAGFLIDQIYEQDAEGNHPNVWMPDVKQIGGGEYAERVDIERFNAAIISELRGTLDDLAKEVGDRRHRVEHAGNVGLNIAVDDLNAAARQAQEAEEERIRGDSG